MYTASGQTKKDQNKTKKSAIMENKISKQETHIIPIQIPQTTLDRCRLENT
jgi:hypothetical protein